MQCRTCAVKFVNGDVCYALFNDEERIGDWVELFLNQLQMWGINIEREDELPKHICQKCLKIFDVIQNFHAQCVEVDDHFRALKNEAPKSEDEYYIDDIEHCTAEIISEIDIKPVGIDVEDALSGKPEVEEYDLHVILDDTIINEKNVSDPVVSDDEEKNNQSDNDSNKMKNLQKDDHDEDSNNSNTNYDDNEDEENNSIDNDELNENNDVSIGRFGETMSWKEHIEVLPNGRTKIKPNPLLCVFCLSDKSEDLMYSTLEEKNAHHKKVHEDKENPYKCVLCKSFFFDNIELKAHFNKIHKYGKICPICGKFVKRVSITHLQRHFKSNYTCKICGMVMQNCSQAQFDYHMKWHDPKKQHKCSYEGCDKSFVAITHLKTHIASHKGVGDFLCSECGRDFLTKAFLKAHAAVEHGANPGIKCNFCDATFRNYGQKKLHLKEKHSNKLSLACDICNEAFPSETGLHIHMRLRHNKNTTKRIKREKEQDVQDRPFECKQYMINIECEKCHNYFHSETGIRLHSRRCKEKYKDGNDTVIKRYKVGGPITCDHCPQVFHTESTLLDHQKVHSSDGRPFPCHQCKKYFKTASNLRTHEQLKHSEKKFQCNVCQKKFAHGNTLTVHMESHNEEKFECDQCGNKFKMKKSLKLHKQIKHNTESNIKCDYCNEKFKYRQKLYTHLKRDHKFLYGKKLVEKLN